MTAIIETTAAETPTECEQCHDGLIEYTVGEGDTETAYCTCSRGDDRRNYTAADAREDAGDAAYHYRAEEFGPEDR